MTVIAGLVIFAGPPVVFFLAEYSKGRKELERFNDIHGRPKSPPPVVVCKERPKPKPAQKAPEKPQKPSINPDTLKAMHIQADAERAIADALERKAQREPDPIKRARIEKQIANSNLRFNNILDKIDKLTEG